MAYQQSTISETKYVDLNLNEDRGPRRFQITMFDARNICRTLNQLPGYAVGGPINPSGLRVLLMTRDPDTWASVLHYGLLHEDQTMTHEKALKLYGDFLASGGSIETAALQLREAFFLSGVWERSIADGGGRGAEGNSSGSSPTS